MAVKSPEKIRMVIDTDCGLDDAQAIMLALGMKKEVELLAITCVAGNTDVVQVGVNVLRVLEVCDSLGKIPVYRGCTQSILGDSPDSSFYHGKDGLGDVEWNEKPDDKVYIEPSHAVPVLMRLVREYPNQITLVTLGPLTNIALACRLCPEFAKMLKACYIMGGNHKGKGNITASAEYNFYADPEAANIAFKTLECPITLITWELCLENPVDMRWYEKEFTGKGTKRSDFAQRIDKAGVENIKETEWPYVWCDQMTAMAAIDESVILDSEMLPCSVELAGECRGQCILYWPSHKSSAPASKIRIVTRIDMNKCYGLMLKSV